MNLSQIQLLARSLFWSILFLPLVCAAQTEQELDAEMALELSEAAPSQSLPKAESIDLKEVIVDLEPKKVVTPDAKTAPPGSSIMASAAVASSSKAAITTRPVDPSPVGQIKSIAPADPDAPNATDNLGAPGFASASSVTEVAEETAPILSKFLLGVEVPPSTATRLVWIPEEKHSGFVEQTPVLIVNGASPGKTLCLTAAVHGDELNGIEMIRRIMYNLDPAKLTGTVIGVPVVNLMGFRRNSRYLPDRRDLNRYFPGNTRGSSASRIAHSFFSKVIRHCDALVDIHTGSFHRTNLTQLRADLADEKVAALAQSFGEIAVLNSRGNSGSLRAAAVRFGIPSVTLEAGEPMRMQSDVVDEGAKAIEMLLTKMGMYGRQSKWSKSAPVYYKSIWVRVNQSGILFSKAPLGKRVMPGEVLGTVTDPVTNARSEIVSPYRGRILGMALDQVVMPGFAAYHIGIQTPEAILIEEGQIEDGEGDDSGVDPTSDDDGDNAGVLTKPQDSLEDE